MRNRFIQGLTALAVLASSNLSHASHEDLSELAIELNSETQTVLQIVESVLIGGSARQKIAMANIQALSDRTSHLQNTIGRDGLRDFDLVEEAFDRADRTIVDLKNVHQVIPAWRRVESLIQALRESAGGFGDISIGQDNLSPLAAEISQGALRLLGLAQREISRQQSSGRQALDDIRQLADVAQDLQSALAGQQDITYLKEELVDSLSRVRQSIRRVRVSQRLLSDLDRLEDAVRELEDSLGGSRRGDSRDDRRENSSRGDVIVIGRR